MSKISNTTPEYHRKHPFNTRLSAKLAVRELLVNRQPYVDLSQSGINLNLEQDSDSGIVNNNENYNCERLHSPIFNIICRNICTGNGPRYSRMLILCSLNTAFTVILLLLFFTINSEVKNVMKAMVEVNKEISSMKDNMVTMEKNIEEIKNRMKETEKYIKNYKIDDHQKADQRRADFALSTSGGEIIMPKGNCGANDLESCNSIHGPIQLISPGNAPGQCWAFEGCTGTVEIKLLSKVKIDSFSLEHIPANLSPSGNLNSAPKEFYVVGLNDCDSTNGDLLGEFSYKIPGPSVQIFRLARPTSKAYEYLKFSVRSNYGNPDFTCVYRFQVHGTQEPESFDVQNNFNI